MDPLWAGNVIQLVFVLGLMVNPPARARSPRPGPASMVPKPCFRSSPVLGPFFYFFCAPPQVAWTGSYVFRVFTKQMTYAKQLDAYEEAVMRKRCACLHIPRRSCSLPRICASSPAAPVAKEPKAGYGIRLRHVLGAGRSAAVYGV